MSPLTRLPQRLLAGAASFEPRALPLALARTLLAAATLSTLALTVDRDLFVTSSAWPAGPHCEGLRAATLWCVGPDSPHLLPVRRLVAVVVLAVVLAGLSPRWTCVPHWYVTASLGTTMTVPNGGDSAARIATLLLIPICLGDPRVWQWSRPGVPLPPAWRGRAYAASLFLRLQVFTIYTYAVVTKLRVPAWRHGTYLDQVFSDPYYGLPASIRGAAGGVLAERWVVAALTWGAIAVELTVAVSMSAGPVWRRRALFPAVALHAGIAALMGIVSFSAVMVALVILAGITGRSSSPASPAGAAPIRNYSTQNSLPSGSCITTNAPPVSSVSR